MSVTATSISNDDVSRVVASSSSRSELFLAWMGWIAVSALVMPEGPCWKLACFMLEQVFHDKLLAASVACCEPSAQDLTLEVK